MPLNPKNIAGGAISGIGALAQMIMGAKQKHEGEAQKKALVRPVYERPDEAKEIGRLTALRYMNPEFAGQRQMEENVGVSTANAIEAAKDFGSSADIYKAQINENNAMEDIGVKAAQQKLQSEAQRIQALEMMADYSDKEFDTNQYIPFQENRQEALANINAGKQNINTGLQTLSSIGSSAAGAGSDAKKSTTDSSVLAGITPIGAQKLSAPSSKISSLGMLKNIDVQQKNPIMELINGGSYLQTKFPQFFQ